MVYAPKWGSKSRIQCFEASFLLNMPVIDVGTPK